MAQKEKPADQSQFVHNQTAVQPPPEVVEKMAYEAEHRDEIRKKKRKIWLIIISFLVFILMIIAVVVLRPTPPPPTPPEPTPTPVPVGPSALQVEMERIQRVVKEADPGADPFAPPPVDMKVKF